MDNQKLLKDALINGILQCFKDNKCETLSDAYTYTYGVVSRANLRYILKRQSHNIGLPQLIACCDHLGIKLRVEVSPD